MGKRFTGAKGGDQNIDHGDQKDEYDAGVVHHVRPPPVADVVDVEAAEDDEDDAHHHLKENGDHNQADGHLKVAVLAGV